MGRFKLNKTGIAKVRKMLRHQVAEVQKAFAVNAYTFLVDFDYHVDGGSQGTGPGGWSFYYVANWNCKVSGIDKSVITPPRAWSEEYQKFAGKVDRQKIFTVTPNLTCGKRISITNSVWYGPILNDGGSDPRFHAESSRPNRFLEQCLNHLEDMAPTLIKDVEEDCPEI